MSIQADDSTNTSLNEDDAVAALITSFDGDESGDDAADDSQDDEGDEELDGDAEDASESGSDEGDEDAPDEGDENGEDDEGDEGPSEAAKEAADDQVVKFTVNGETQEVTVGSLKRLAGQEAALTRKSQEADLVGGRAAAALQAAIEATVEDLQPYQQVDWLTLQSELDPETFKWHRENAGRAQARYNKLVQQAQGFEQVIQERQTAETVRRAEEANKALSDPQTGIRGWGDQLYGEIIDYGVSAGLDEKDVANITDPVVIRLLHKAMLHDKSAKATATKVKDAPTKVLKTGGRDQTGSQTSVNAKKAQARLAKSGTEEDAVALLVGRWG